MRKAILTLASLLLLASTAFTDTFRVHYSVRGSGRDVTVQAESSSEARRTVMDMFPGAVVRGVHREAAWLSPAQHLQRGANRDITR